MTKAVLRKDFERPTSQASRRAIRTPARHVLCPVFVPGGTAVTVAQDFSPGTALWVNDLVPDGTTESLLYRTNSIASQAGFTRSRQTADTSILA